MEEVTLDTDDSREPQDAATELLPFVSDAGISGDGTDRGRCCWVASFSHHMLPKPSPAATKHTINTIILADRAFLSPLGFLSNTFALSALNLRADSNCGPADKKSGCAVYCLSCPNSLPAGLCPPGELSLVGVADLERPAVAGEGLVGEDVEAVATNESLELGRGAGGADLRIPSSGRGSGGGPREPI